MPDDIQLQIHLETPASPALTDRLSHELFAEMRDLPVQLETPKGGAAPKGSKAIELAVLGAWIVKLAPTVVPKLLDLIKDWISRHPQTPLKVSVKRGNRSVAIEYDPKKNTLADIEAMADRLLK